MLSQQIGLASNGRDAADLYRYQMSVQQGADDEVAGYDTRDAARRRSRGGRARATGCGPSSWRHAGGSSSFSRSARPWPGWSSPTG